MFSSSVVDVFAGFAQTYSFLERLKWPDMLEYSAFVTMFVEVMNSNARLLLTEC